MKHIFAISLMFSSLCIAKAQVVPNGGFEEWGTIGTVEPYPYPLMWSWTNFFVNPNCPVLGNATMEPSPLSSSGCCSVKLTTHWCKFALLYSGDHNVPSSVFDCMARPAHLNFHYMFHPVGGDSAYVKILLFNSDSMVPGNDTVGFASGYMHEQVNAFTPFSLPIHYFSTDTPAYMHIRFSTSKTLSEMYPIYFGPPGEFASVGTTLWLDDVHLSGTTDIREEAPKETLTIFPNPAGDHIWFKGLDVSDDLYALVFDAKGAQVMDQRIKDPDSGMDVSGLRPGVHTITLFSRDSVMLRTTWVKE